MEFIENFFAGAPVWLNALLFIVGLALIIKGGDWFVDSASWIAEVLGVPKFVIGATIVSIATTLPEMIVSIAATIRGNVDMAAGNAIGSVTANTAMIMAVFIVCMPFYESKVFMYTYVSIASFIFGAFVSLFSTFLNVEFMKKIDEAYLARSASIMTSLSVASMPVASAVVSVLVTFVKTEWFFIVTGVLVMVICPFFLRSDVLAEQQGELELSVS